MYILTQRVYIDLDPAFQELKEKKKKPAQCLIYQQEIILEPVP